MFFDRYGYVLSLIMLLIVGGALIAGAVRVYKNNGHRAEKGRQWVEESVSAWRSKELSRGQFDIHVTDTKLDDLFSTFDHDDGDPYYSPDGIENQMVNVTGSELPSRIVDATELVVLRALEAAKNVKAKHEAEKVAHEPVQAAQEQATQEQAAVSQGEPSQLAQPRAAQAQTVEPQVEAPGDHEVGGSAVDPGNRASA